MKLRNGKKYETADGVVYRVMERHGGVSFEVAPEDRNQWSPSGVGIGFHSPDLVRRHYTKPQPAHKLALKEGDVVELVEWEDGIGGFEGDKITAGKYGALDHWCVEFKQPKSKRPLFRVVSRA